MLVSSLAERRVNNNVAASTCVKAGWRRICEPRKIHNAGEKAHNLIKPNNKQETMTLSLLSSLLLLGSAAADRNNIFGRSVHKRSSPLKRIRRAERKASLVTEEVTTIKTPLTEDGVQKKPTAEIATVKEPRILIEDGVQTEPITSRVLDALSSMPSSFELSMSSMIHFEEMSMSMLDFSMPSKEPPTDATPTPSAVVPPATADPNMDLASLFAIALVSDIPIGA